MFENGTAREENGRGAVEGDGMLYECDETTHRDALGRSWWTMVWLGEVGTEGEKRESLVSCKQAKSTYI